MPGAATGLSFRSLLAILVRGVLFLVPLVLLVVLAREAVRLLSSATKPVTQLVPAENVLGIAVVEIAAVILLALICFAAGLFAGTRFGGRLGARLERMILNRIPGFTLVKSMGHGLVGERDAADVRVALAWIEESWVLAFVMERHGNGLSTVFVPSAPTPAAGSVYYLPDDRLKLVDVPVQSAMACITRLGLGSRELLAKALPDARSVKP
jgi:uncharacterized membrane protein